MLSKVSLFLPAAKSGLNIYSNKQIIQKQSNTLSFSGKVKKNPDTRPVEQKKIFDDNHILNPIIKSKLDKTNFVIETENGNELITIKEAIAKSDHTNLGNIESTVYKGCFSEEEINNIKRRGFKTNSINRTTYGPGFYFACSEGEAREYGSAVMKANVRGNCWIFKDPKWYDKITTPAVYKFIKNYTGVNDPETLKSIINEYVRSLMSNDFDVDCAYCFRNCICFSPRAIKSIESMEKLCNKPD